MIDLDQTDLNIYSCLPSTNLNLLPYSGLDKIKHLACIHDPILVDNTLKLHSKPLNFGYYLTNSCPSYISKTILMECDSEEDRERIKDFFIGIHECGSREIILWSLRGRV